MRDGVGQVLRQKLAGNKGRWRIILFATGLPLRACTGREEGSPIPVAENRSGAFEAIRLLILQSCRYLHWAATTSRAQHTAMF